MQLISLCKSKKC